MCYRPSAGPCLIRSNSPLAARLHWGVAAVAAAVFACWFSIRQMEAVSRSFAANAPGYQYATTAFTVALFVFALHAAALMTVRRSTDASAPLLRAGALLIGVLLTIFMTPLCGAVAFALLIVVLSLR